MHKDDVSNIFEITWKKNLNNPYLFLFIHPFNNNLLSIIRHFYIPHFSWQKRHKSEQDQVLLSWSSYSRKQKANNCISKHMNKLKSANISEKYAVVLNAM